jgi:tripartite-type tricarboxylate transporter receptor subunit TctC
MLLRLTLALLAHAVPYALAASVAGADEYPSRTITLVVPFPAGGGNDAMARLMAERLGAELGRTVVVDNRGGAGGIVGTRSVAKAAPDGYTLMLGHTGSVGINPTLYAHAGFSPRKDFTPIGLIASMPLALLANPSVPARSVAELIALAKKDPGKIAIGSSSKGTGSHMCAELFMHEADAKMNLVPYRGTSLVLSDLIAGHVQVTFNVIPQAIGNIKSGALRALAVTTPTRTALLPDVPTIAESGLPGFEAVLYYGLLAPAGTPRPIIDKINAAMRTSLQNPAVRERIAADGADPIASTPEEYGAIIDRDEAKWGALIKALNLKIE